MGLGIINAIPVVKYYMLLRYLGQLVIALMDTLLIPPIKYVPVIFLNIIECQDAWASSCNLNPLSESTNCFIIDGVLLDTSNKLCVCAIGKYKGKLCLDQSQPDTSCTLDEKYSCIDCPVGTYKKDIGIPLSCLDCPLGTYGLTTGADKCTDCPSGTYGPKIKATLISDCEKCPFGTYRSDPKGTSISDCAECPKGTYGPNKGVTSVGGCIDCPPGTYGSISKATLESDCHECPAGTFNPDTGSVSDIACISCPAGKYGPIPKASSCLECQVGTYSTIIKATSESVCTNCPTGTYGPNLAATSLLECEECPVGTYGPNTGVSSVNNCLKCPIGKYNPNSGSSSFEACIDCPIGTFNKATGSSSCDFFCHNLCSRCYDEKNNQCYQCYDDIDQIAPFQNNICECNSGFFYDSTKTQKEDYCQPCEDFCLSCNSERCFKCEDEKNIRFVSGKCSCIMPGSVLIYDSVAKRNKCAECHILCESCVGVLSTQCLSCNSKIGAIMIFVETCACPSSYYYDASLEKCEKCNSLCSECFGPSNKECYDCNSPLSYIVEDELTWCVIECDLLGAYYLKGDTCLSIIFTNSIECHSDCSSCIGKDSNNCLSCASSENVLFENECMNNCPSHYLEVSGICMGNNFIYSRMS